MKLLFVIALTLGLSFGGFVERHSNDKNEITFDFYNETDIDVCNTTDCENAGKDMKAHLNPKVDPCDDFYEFACGGWEASHTIPDDKPFYFGDIEISDNIRQIITKSLTETRSKDDSKAVNYASDLYKSCIDESTRESVGVSPLLDVLGDWPLIDNNSKYDEVEYDWRDTFVSMITELSMAPIFDIQVTVDPNDTNVNAITFDVPALGLGRNQLLNPDDYPDIVRSYKEYILQSALLLGANNDSQTLDDIEDMFAFEAQLANETQESRDLNTMYNRMSYEDFTQLTDNRVDWLNLTNRIYSKLNSTIVVKSDELVVILDIDFYKNVAKLLDMTPKRVIANYMGWQVVKVYGQWTTSAFRKVNFDFNHVMTGVVKDTDIPTHCVGDLSTVMDNTISRLYIDKSFSKNDKQEASDVVKDIKDAFTELINENEWLDEKTKNMSLLKLDSIERNVGFPDWILSNDQLDKYYDLKQTVDSKQFFKSIQYLIQNSVQQEFNALRESVDKNLDWPMAAFIVNAEYNPTQNSITIPAGQLSAPYFSANVPNHLNYGAIGSVVGHELTHGFDDQGSQFDSKGNLRNWWTNETLSSFTKKAKCFTEEYSSYNDSQSGLKLRGENTVGEDIADNGGIRESFRAYELYVKRHGKPQRLSGVDEYTVEQQFFISYANTWCSKYRTEYLKNMIQYNPHSPAKYRVNVPLSNFKTFSDSFNCSSNARMNRKDKCILW